MQNNHPKRTRVSDQLVWMIRGIFLLVIAIWTLFVLSLSWKTNINYPTYGDGFRLVEEFIIPLDSARESVWKLVFQEYIPLSHGHVLTRIVLWCSSVFLNFNFRLLWVVGTVGYFSTLYLIYKIVWLDFQRVSVPYIIATTLALCCTLAYIRPDELNTISSNFLYYEYIFFSGSLMYLRSYIRCMETGRYKLYVMMLVLAIILFDVTGFIAISASAIQGILSLLRSRFKPIKLVFVTPTISLICLYAVKRVFFFWQTSASLSVYEQPHLIDSVGYFVRSLGQVVVNISALQHILVAFRFSADWALPIHTVVGIAVSLLMLASLLLLLGFTTAVTDFQGSLLLSLFGLISIAGTFITRASFSPDQAFQLRYIRYLSFAGFVFVPSLYYAIAQLSLFRRHTQIIVLSAGFLILFRASLLGSVYAEPQMHNILTYYDRYRAVISDYQPASSASFDLIQPYMHRPCSAGKKTEFCHEVPDYIFLRHARDD